MCRMSDSSDETFLEEYVEQPRSVRQGLPPGFRMRHDAHYVDELESRRRPVDPVSPGLAFPTSIPVTFALRDMSQEMEGVASCFNLVDRRARPLRERVGLSLARVGVQRNMRAFQALRVLLEDPAPERTAISLNTIVEQAVLSFDEELRIIESRAALDLHDAPIRANADARMMLIALQGCVGTLAAMIEASGQGGAIHVATRSGEGVACCEMRQDSYRMAAEPFSRLADLEWCERPGGIPAGMSLAAAARIAQAHGGALDAHRTEAGGCTLSLSVRM
jgi:hypothetical protein